jgi:hypothetical protein
VSVRVYLRTQCVIARMVVRMMDATCECTCVRENACVSVKAFTCVCVRVCVFSLTPKCVWVYSGYKVHNGCWPSARLFG